MNIYQISSKDPLTRLVTEGLTKTAPFLRDALFYSRGGSADNVKKAAGGSSQDIFRTLNETNLVVATQPEYSPVAKKIVSFDTKVDVMLEDRNENTEAELVVQTKLDAEEAGFYLQHKFFEGNSSYEDAEIDGLRSLVIEDNVVTTSTDGLSLPLGISDTKITAQQRAIEELMKLFARVRGGATHVYMNEFMKIRLLTIAKNLGYYRMEKDELGSTVESIGDVIIRGAGYRADGSTILPFDETVGTSANKCTSIFAVRWGTRSDLTALTSVGVKVRYAGQVGNFVSNNTNFDLALVLQNDNAVVQSKGWRLD